MKINPNDNITVGMLKEYLSSIADDTLIVMSNDGEGNGYSGYSPIGAIGTYYYAADSECFGELWEMFEDTKKEKSGVPEDAVPAIVMWPVN